MKKEQLNELLYQMLETEMGGEKVYATALKCAQNKDLKEEWTEYLEQTRNHVAHVRNVFTTMGLEPETVTPGRLLVREKGKSLIAAMEKSLAEGNKQAAQLVAAECVVDAETRDHLNWELLGMAVKELSGAEAKAVKDAHEEVEDEEDEHLYHTTGWLRELWLDSLGLRAVLPPPEERKKVQTAIGAARAKQARGSMRSTKPSNGKEAEAR